jgi:hypothetical protein
MHVVGNKSALGKCQMGEPSVADTAAALICGCSDHVLGFSRRGDMMLQEELAVGAHTDDRTGETDHFSEDVVESP